MSRMSREQNWMAIAQVVAMRGTCPRLRVGAVAVVDNAVVASGYNGAMRGLPHCEDTDDHMLTNGHCGRAVHAEANLVANAGSSGNRIAGANIFVTAHPCWNCFELLVNAKVRHIYYAEAYRPDPRINPELFQKLWGNGVQISLTHLEDFRRVALVENPSTEVKP